MALSKKDVIESLKAMEIDYDPTLSASKLNELLDKAMGTSIEDNKVDINKDSHQKEDLKPKTVSLSDVLAYEKAKELKKIGK